MSLLVVGQLIGLFSLINQKQKIADQFAELVKREMILSDLGELRTKLTSFKGFFEVIELYNNDGVLLYTSGETQSSYMSLQRIIIPKGSSSSIGELKIEFSVLEMTPLATLVWFAVTLISLPLFVYGNRKRVLSHKMSQELAKLEEKQSFAKKIAHDLRAPLSIIKSSVSNPGKIERQITDKAFVRIEDIVDGLLNDKTFEKVEKVHLNSLLRDMFDEKRQFVQNNEIEFNLEMVESDIYCEINSVMLKRILSNLIKNAIEATSKGTIKLNLKLSSEHSAIISIIDSGIGMSKETITKVMGDEVYTSKSDGHGIGIKSARDFLRENANDMEISSVEGLGTKIDIVLNGIEALQKNKSSKVVLIDDDEFIHMMWSCLIKDKEQFESYKSVNEFTSKLPEISLNASIFIDLNIGTESGIALAKELKVKGYHNLYLQTGERFEGDDSQIFKSILSKDFPSHILHS